MTSDRPDVSVAVDAAIALMAPICLTQDVALALDAVREMARLAEQRAFEEGQNSMMRSLREARRDRDEAREQVRSLTTRVDQMETAYRQAEEAVRSLTVERDQWKADRDQAYAFWKREQARADDLAGDFGQCSRDKGDLRARLSRAREALERFDEPGRHSLNWKAYDEVRAALAEPPAG